MMTLLMDKKNPLKINNPRIEALDDAYKWFLEVLDNFATEKNITAEEIADLKKIVFKEYMNKKMSYTLDHKLSILSKYIDSSMCSALRENSLKEKPSTSLVYMKHTKHLLSNEQY
ncbi:hypothetical protein Oweho_1889 [Owenweeksia hongkongensis DSM 17368]|uniref:Uncharacterized protein n=1 Tax=Owenweeksia hongkongensis (strain DSM 17368 / CIP 108786 / JCM 12287 / NRRL B-23963 / UST20020801) TaxID=926562 RepID=G8R1U2_OWEHD|nr:hypothetical protein [Owenweeksia hongkongensis]AEV32868.1 hypothetical protein Oweho_1889 [Owenweeksia hongkongensis DSM 17368]